MSDELGLKREAVRPLISLSDPGDALTAYYALYHSPSLTRLHVHRDQAGTVDGFLVVCTTGADLFRPLVVLRSRSDEVLRTLLRQTLVASRPYRLVTPLRYAGVIDEQLAVSERRVGTIMTLDRTRFSPVINVLVVSSAGASGGLRFEIRSGSKVMAASGTNWESSHFAEVYVYCEPEARGRGWGKSVASACTQALLEKGVRPLYVVADEDEISMRLALSLGYRDSERREFIASGVSRA